LAYFDADDEDRTRLTEQERDIVSESATSDLADQDSDQGLVRPAAGLDDAELSPVVRVICF
jgi:hypothetical protein